MLVTEQMVTEIEKVGLLRSPNEACGFAFDDGPVVELPNASLEPRHRWRFGPIREVKKILEDHGVKFSRVGAPEHDYLVWHTHPRGQGGPSRVDLVHRVPGVEFLVVALTRYGPKATRY